MTDDQVQRALVTSIRLWADTAQRHREAESTAQRRAVSDLSGPSGVEVGVFEIENDRMELRQFAAKHSDVVTYEAWLVHEDTVTDKIILDSDTVKGAMVEALRHCSHFGD